MCPAKFEWPKVRISDEISPEIMEMRLPEGFSFTEEEIATDNRLAHALGVR
jgi:hypothetical protein